MSRPPSSANQNRARPSAWKNAIAITAPAEEPSVTPITSGLASGLRSRVWKMVPESPKAVLTSSATTAVGRRWSITMKEYPGTTSPLIARSARSSGTIGVPTSTRTITSASSSSPAAIATRAGRRLRAGRGGAAAVTVPPAVGYGSGR